MHTNPFTGNLIRSLLHELSLVSGKQFRSECILLPGEELGQEKRIDLYSFVHGKISVVQSLTELHGAFHGVEQFLLYNHKVEPGYEKFAEKYQELLMRRWVIGADKFKRGYDPNPQTEWRTWAYGLVEIDQHFLDELRSALEDVEQQQNITITPTDTSHGVIEAQSDNPTEQHKVGPKPTKLIPVLLFIIGIVIALVTNVASNVLPKIVQPYLWLSWPLLIVFIILALILLVKQ